MKCKIVDVCPREAAYWGGHTLVGTVGEFSSYGMSPEGNGYTCGMFTPSGKSWADAIYLRAVKVEEVADDGDVSVEEKPAHEGSDALRYNEGKPKLSYNLLGKEVVEGEAAVWERGAEKYSRGNWLKGRAYTDCADSLLRHLHAFLRGENIDAETKLPHPDHIVCCAKILSNSFHTRPDLDDRSK